MRYNREGEIEMSIRYYALILDDREADDPHSVFREVREARDYRTDVWDRELRNWRLQMSLAAYIIDGEVGAVEITRAEADRVIATQRN